MSYPGAFKENHVTALDCLLPPQAVPLVVMLIILLPLALLTGESLLMPLMESSKSMMETQGTDELASSAMLPLQYFIKLIGFLILSFFGLVQLFLRLNTVYIAVWGKTFPRPHPLHVDYASHPNKSFLALLNWNMYRFCVSILPSIGVFAAIMLLGPLWLLLFNFFTDIMFISLPFQFTVGIFVMLVLFLLLGITLLYSGWMTFTSIFGSIVAITEPDLPAKSIMDRCGRIAFSSPLVYFLYPAYGFFMALVGVECFLLFEGLDIQDLITFKANVPLILICELVTLFLYISLNYFRFYTYHTALKQYYNKLPKHYKERFTPPPRAQLSAG